MVKISVIIPCYNMKNYVRECLNSVLAQTLQEIEIICIDDGSEDGTYDILKEYENKADNVNVRRQENQGSGIARNLGISVAKGEYIAFMDADDFYPARDTLEKMYYTAKREQAEICGGSGCVFRDGVYTYTGFRRAFTFSKDGWIGKEDYPNGYGYWRFIYQNDFIQKNHICFPGYMRGQDLLFFLKAIACAGRLYCMREVTYVYRKGHKHVSFAKQNAIDSVKVLRDSLIFSRQEGLHAIYRYILYDLLHEQASAVMYLYGQENAEMQQVIHQINEAISDGGEAETEIALFKEGNEITKYINESKEEIESLLETLKREKRILIYGAGVFGKKIKRFLDENGIGVEAFAVTDPKQNAAFLEGLQVKCIDDYLEDKDECAIVIATFPYLIQEIQEMLRQKKFRNVYIISVEKYHLYIGEVVH